jgi:hypothetical protein
LRQKSCKKARIQTFERITRQLKLNVTFFKTKGTVYRFLLPPKIPTAPPRCGSISSNIDNHGRVISFDGFDYLNQIVLLNGDGDGELHMKPNCFTNALLLSR